MFSRVVCYGLSLILQECAFETHKSHSDVLESTLANKRSHDISRKRNLGLDSKRQIRNVLNYISLFNALLNLTIINFRRFTGIAVLILITDVDEISNSIFQYVCQYVYVYSMYKIVCIFQLRLKSDIVCKILRNNINSIHRCVHCITKQSIA